MTAHPPALLDSDTLSEIMKGRDQHVLACASEYLQEHRAFQLSIITRYEILRGLFAKGAVRQAATFLRQCRKSTIYPVTEEIADRAATIYAVLHRQGQLISDADILIAATALVRDLVLVTGNEDHFRRIVGLRGRRKGIMRRYAPAEVGGGGRERGGGGRPEA